MEEVTLRLQKMNPEEPCLTLVALGFDSFNSINALYGDEVGSHVLEQTCYHIDDILGEGEIFCRLLADQFLLCLQTGEAGQAAQVFCAATDLKNAVADCLPSHHTIAASGGILVVKDSTIPLPALLALLEQASCARKNAKGSAASALQFYDKKTNEEAPKCLDSREGAGRNRWYPNIAPQKSQIDSWEIYTMEKNIDLAVMGGYLDGETAAQCVNDRALEHRIRELEETLAAQRDALEVLRQSEECYRIVADLSDAIIFQWDFATDSICFSEKYEVLFGRPHQGTTNLTTNPDIYSTIHPDDVSALKDWVAKTYRQVGRFNVSFRVADVNGQYLWMALSSAAICDQDGTPIKAVGSFHNVQAQRDLVDDLTSKALHDPLTGLLNKVSSQLQIDEYLRGHPFVSGVLFMMDVDNFKQINDNLGHQMGDTVLKEIAATLRRVFPETTLVGRIGGDEFVVYVSHMDEDAARSKAEQLAESLHIFYFGAMSKYEISGSIGMARYGEHGTTFAELYHNADTALYQAKKRGKNCFVTYSDTIAAHSRSSHTPVEYTENFINTYFKNDIAFQVFEMLYETKDVATSIHLILELLGRQLGLDRVNIFEFIEEDTFILNTYEWCAPEVEEVIHDDLRLSMDALWPYFSLYSAEGIYCCQETETSVEIVREIAQLRGIKSLLHCAIHDKRRQIGFIGFEHCRAHHSWRVDEIAVMGYISRILSVFMTKNQVADQLQFSYQNYAGIVECLRGYVYVIDAATFEVLFVNRAIREELGLAAGAPCYLLAYGADSQCAMCPVRQLQGDVQVASSEIYSEVLHKWIHSTASKMKWEDNQDAVLICCTDSVKNEES